MLTVFAKLDDDEEFLNDVWFSDESHFLLNGYISSMNWVLSGSENLYKVIGRPLHSKKCKAWVTISKLGTVGPFFCEDDRNNPMAVKKESYIPILEQFLEELAVWFGLVLWHIHYCRLLMPNPFLYIYTVLFQAIHFNISMLFVYSLNIKTDLFQTIQFSISTQLSSV